MTFSLTSWTTRPERILDSCTLCVPKPFEDELPFLHMWRMLKYPIQIRVQRLLLRQALDMPPSSPPPTPPSTDSSEDVTPHSVENTMHTYQSLEQ